MLYNVRKIIVLLKIIHLILIVIGNLNKLDEKLWYLI